MLRLFAAILLALVCAASFGAHAQTFREYPFKGAGYGPAPVFTADGTPWLQRYNGFSRVTASGTQDFTSDRLGGRYPNDGSISSWIVGPDDAIWFTKSGQPQIGRMTKDGTFSFFSLLTENASAHTLTIGSDGNIWFAETYDNVRHKFGRITPAGVVTEFDTYQNPKMMVLAPDGNLWFVENGAAGYVTPQGETRIFYPDYNPSNSDDAITVGPDGNLWYSSGPDSITRVTLQGQFKLFQIYVPGSQEVDAYPYPREIILGPDGNLWFLIKHATGVGRLTPSGVYTEFRVQTYNRDYFCCLRPMALTAGPDGNVWFVANDELYRVTPTGEVTKIPNLFGAGTVVSPLGEMWFAGGTRYSDSALMKADMSTPGMHIGQVKSSRSTAQQSSIRLYNKDEVGDTATVTLSDGATGAVLGRWTSPVIPAFAEREFDIATLESALGAFTKPESYKLTVKADFNGYFQHVVRNTANGALTNLSSCMGGAPFDRETLIGVLSSRVVDYPTSVVIANARPGEVRPTLAIFDASSGTRLGTFQAGPVAGFGQVIVPVKTIETAAGITPLQGNGHYVVKAEGNVGIHLQNLVNNINAGFVTDMTAFCQLDPTHISEPAPVSNMDVPDPGSWEVGRELAGAADGSIWYAASSALVRIAPDGNITRFATSYPAASLAAGPDGNMWYITNYFAGKFTPAGVRSEYGGPYTVGNFTIMAGPDGKMWFSSNTGSARMSTTGQVSNPSGFRAQRLTMGPDGTVWGIATAFSGLLHMGADGISEGFSSGGRVFNDIAAGRDGNTWYTGTLGATPIVGRMTMTGEMQDLSSPLIRSPFGITSGRDNTVWFGSYTSIGRVGLGNTVTTYRIPGNSNGPPGRMTAAANGDIWVAHRLMSKLSKVDVSITTPYTGIVTPALSFLRFYNGDDTPGVVRIGFADTVSGRVAGVWTSPLIPPGSEQQFIVDSMLAEIGLPRAGVWAANVESEFGGSFQHVIWQAGSASLLNITTCNLGAAFDARTVSGVHSSLMTGYPSTLAVMNTGASARAVTLAVLDSVTGRRLGSYRTPSIPAGGQLALTMAEIEKGAGVTPPGPHLVVQVEGIFTGYLQHLVNNSLTGVLSDMTASCRLRAA